jgi:hypothetical protein
MIVAASSFSWAGPQSLTFAIPIGTLIAFGLWGFFQRRPTR